MDWEFKYFEKEAVESWHWTMQAESWVPAIELEVESWILTIEDVVGFFGSLPTEILNITGCAARLWGQMDG